MKKQILKFAAVKFYTTALLTTILLTTGALQSNAAANADTTQQSADTARQPKVSYIGVNDELLKFNVQFENNISKMFILELVDQSGEVLYSKKFEESKFNRNVYLKNLGDSEDCKVSFVIRAGKQVYNQGFDINLKRTFIQDAVVTRL